MTQVFISVWGAMVWVINQIISTRWMLGLVILAIVFFAIGISITVLDKVRPIELDLEDLPPEAKVELDASDEN